MKKQGENRIFTNRLNGTINIWRLEKSDIQTIKELWQELNAHHKIHSKNFKNHFAHFTFKKRAKVLLANEKLAIFVAERNNNRLGYSVASVNDRAGEIDSLFVLESERGKNIGRNLLVNALKWLGNQKCDTIKVIIAEGNESAVGFYKRFGFAERGLIMQMKRANKSFQPTLRARKPRPQRG